MKKHLIALSLALSTLPALALDTPLPPLVADLAHNWAKINYRTPEKERANAFKDLALQAEQIVQANPGHAEPMIWEAIILASEAKADGGLGALGQVRHARDLLLEAERIDAHALNGSIYTSLGSLYAKVPGWPISFGDAKKARGYLETALKINPDGIDAHYFYADYLADHGEYAQAAEHLKLAAAAPARPGREDADAGRRSDIDTLMAQLQRDHARDLGRQ